MEIKEKKSEMIYARFPKDDKAKLAAIARRLKIRPSKIVREGTQERMATLERELQS